ncbi:hypothetical protein DSUL_50464 [Desulfovibrionales bacterium]
MSKFRPTTPKNTLHKKYDEPAEICKVNSDIPVIYIWICYDPIPYYNITSYAKTHLPNSSPLSQYGPNRYL